jgi:XrtN system VIT domain protein
MSTQNLTSVTDQSTETKQVVSLGKINLLNLGYFLLAVSFLLYGICEWAEMKDNFFIAFCVHYFIAIAYSIMLIIGRAFGMIRSWRKENMNMTVVLVNLFLISAYALNRELVVFADSADWFCVYVIVTSLSLLSFAYFEKLPLWVNQLQFFFIGTATLLYLYLAIYVANFYILGGVGLLAFGIGGHVFVPLVLFAVSIVLYSRNRQGANAVSWLVAGIILPIFMLVAFSATWYSRISKIEKVANQSVMFNDAELPVWTKIAQQIPNDWISQRILKEDLVYVTANKNFGDISFMPQSVSWDAIKKHDPLVFISSLIKKSSLSKEDRVKIIQAISGGRHEANERLWSGDNLTTSYIVTDVDIYPDLRIAYTEKYLNVKNNSENGGWWGNTEEGIYTFYLPEGSVVTSLSLWIDGQEEKGILTSKKKATEAYKTIVGRERRDPSVIHWQEGNTVTVRVFPCTVNEERKFKIGITSPLVEENGSVIYKNISFAGPNPDEAEETTRVRFVGSSENISLDDSYERNSNGDYVSEHTYDPDFEISFYTVPLKQNAFTFDGTTYSIAQYKPNYQVKHFKTIFLDINNMWRINDLNALRELTDSFEVATYLGESKVKLERRNWDEVIRQASRQNFSLFPFHKIEGAENTLVITKGQVHSPHLSDLTKSSFAENITNLFSSGMKVNVFNLDGGSSTYINSLKEFRALNYAAGSVSELFDLLSRKEFPIIEESSEQVVLPGAGLVIRKQSADSTAIKNNAPDHLARLFFYNDIMRKVGATYFNNDFINEALVDEAATAYVVSPVSSLIVLETKEDYKRFDINDKENSLHNATKQSSGAVPEPHEWALIILFAILVIYLQLKS